jgi:hypothetical protein
MGQSQALERPLRVNNLHFAQLQLTRRASKGRGVAALGRVCRSPLRPEAFRFNSTRLTEPADLLVERIEHGLKLYLRHLGEHSDVLHVPA